LDLFEESSAEITLQKRHGTIADVQYAKPKLKENLQNIPIEG
jgi:hypothetical protein